MSNRKLKLFLTEFLPPIAITIASLVIFLVLVLTHATFSSNSQVLLYAVICWIPALLFLVSGFKFRLPPALKIGFYSFVTFSNLVATTFNLYTFLPVFDTLLHSLFGYVFGYCAIFALVYFGDYQKMSFFARALFIFLATVGIGMLWEVCEYAVDVFTSANSQHEIESGLLDTMQDSFCNIGGACLFAVHYLIDRLFFNNRLFNFAAKSLAVYRPGDELHGKEAELDE